MKSRTLDPNAHGYERPLDKKRGLFEKKKGFSGRNLDFWAQKRRPLLNGNHALATTGCAKKKVLFSQMNISLLANFGCFFGGGENRFLARFPLFGKK